jgi:membrane-bound lytic murein transglycosylase D
LKVRTAITLMTFLLAGCGPAAPRQTRVVVPPQPIVTTPAQPVPSPVATSLPEDAKVDPVGLVIVEARIRFEHGQDLYDQGYLQRAKAEFDGALDLLLDSAAMYPKNPRLDREITDMVNRTHALEMSAFKTGDGFTDQTQEHAAIDDLEAINTFPSPIDPKLRREVEDDIADTSHDLPVEINDRVMSFLDYYQNGRGRTFIELGLERAGKYQSMIEDVLKEEGVPQDLIYLCQAESAFLPRAVSRAKAKGMWQFMSSRGKEYGLTQNWWIDERSDPEKSTRAAARHLKDLYDEFGDWYLAMAAYNAGPVRIQRAMDKTGATDFWQLADKKALPKETINYVPTILALSIIGKNPEKYGFTIEPTSSLETERVTVDKATDLRVIAEAIHVSVDELKDLNPQMLRGTTPPDDPDFELILPKGYSEAFNKEVANLPEAKRVLFRYHTVVRNDTLSSVARKYGTTISQLTQANNISVRKPLRIGQELLIPMSGIGPSSAASVARSSGKTAAKPSPARSASSPYTIRRGDTLSSIATKFHVTVTDLKEWNHLPSSRLTAGKKLIVMASSQPTSKSAATASTKKIIHKVRSGETLVQIAMAYNTTVDAILSWNKTNDLTVIHPGDRITIFLGNR